LLPADTLSGGARERAQDKHRTNIVAQMFENVKPCAAKEKAAERKGGAPFISTLAPRRYNKSAQAWRSPRKSPGVPRHLWRGGPQALL
jgi:hypothetical protein